MLASGWSGGELCLWNVGDGLDPTSVSLEGHAQIAHLLWSSNGFRVMVADITGLLVEYKVGSLSKIKRSAGIESCF